MRAVYLNIACDTSTEELMHVIHCALARCGDINTIICDPGTNLVGMSNLLTEWRKGWDKEKLTVPKKRWSSSSSWLIVTIRMGFPS